MINSINSIPAAAELKADICIIGGGPAGITLALALAGGSRKVLVLESGGLKLDPATQDLAAGEASGVPYFRLDQSRYRLLGGSTFRWGARSAPMKPIDLAVRDWAPGSGWPIALEELTRYYETVFRKISLHPFDFDGDVWGQLKGDPPAFDADLLQFTAFQFGKNVLFGEVFRTELREAVGVEVLTDANVTAIEPNERGDHVERLQVGSLGGGRWTVKARTFVLAAGGIENARLLLLSDSANPNGLGNTSDLVGRNFMDHPTVSAGAIVSDRWQHLLDSGSPGLLADRLVEVGLAISPRIQAERRCLNAVVRPNVVISRDPTQALRELLRNLRSRRLPHQLDWYQKNQWLIERLGAVLSDPWSIVANSARHALGKPKRFKVDAVYLEVRTEQAPNPDSRVTLSDELDPFRLRRAKLHWALNELDKRTMQVAAELYEAELRRLGLGELRVEPWLASNDLTFGADMVGGHHHMGTTRMSASPADGVVAPDGRMHEVDNLYVAGSSVFPTAGFVNPTATLMALSLRLADRLKALS